MPGFSLSLSEQLVHVWHLMDAEVRGQRFTSGQSRGLGYKTAAESEPKASMKSHYEEKSLCQHIQADC